MIVLHYEFKYLLLLDCGRAYNLTEGLHTITFCNLIDYLTGICLKKIAVKVDQ